MASRLAQRRLEEEGVIKRRRVTAGEERERERERARQEKIQKRMQTSVPVTTPDVETAPVPAPATIQTKEDMSNTLKEILQPKQEVKPDVISPPKEVITNDQVVKYNPETKQHRVVNTTPAENLKTIEQVIQSIPAPTQAPVEARSSIEARLPKRSFETPQQYTERIDRVIAQEQRLQRAGITAGQRADAIVKQAQGITEQREKEQKAQQQQEQAYFNDPWVQERLAMKEARAREDAIFNPIVQGLTDVMDVFVHALPVLGGGAGGVLAQAYKNFAPPTSKFHQNISMEDKTVNFLTENLKDKAKDLGTGIAVGQLKNAVNLAKGYRGISLSNKTAVKNFGIGKPSVNNPVAPLREGSTMFVPKTAPATSTTPIQPLQRTTLNLPVRT